MTSEVILHLMQNLCLNNVSINSTFYQIGKKSRILKKKKSKKLTSMTFEDKLHIIKKLCLYYVSIHTKGGIPLNFEFPS